MHDIPLRSCLSATRRVCACSFLGPQTRDALAQIQEQRKICEKHSSEEDNSKDDSCKKDSLARVINEENTNKEDVNKQDDTCKDPLAFKWLHGKKYS